ncbi:Adenylyl cyclase class-3/4/guanylyl cyclase [Trinorchestia longiramus]|nr:Adenylyl cyclase class-3/4/guanylyl cyclase [Trinorchestia longiramus]
MSSVDETGGGGGSVCRSSKGPDKGGDSSYKNKLQKELVSRDGRKELLRQTSPVLLSFKSPATEQSYKQHRETFSGAATTAIPLVLLVIAIVRAILMPRSGGGPVVLLSGLLLLIAMASVSAARSFPMRVPTCLVVGGDRVHSSVCLRTLWFTSLVLIAALTNFTDMYLCNNSLFNDMIYGNSSNGAVPNGVDTGVSPHTRHHHQHRHSSRRQPNEGMTIFIEEEEKHNEVFIKVMSVLEDGNETSTSPNTTLDEGLEKQGDASQRDYNPHTDGETGFDRELEGSTGWTARDGASGSDRDSIMGGDVLESIGLPGIYSHDYDYQGEEGGYNAEICPYPTYHTYFTVLLLLGATLLAQVSHGVEAKTQVSYLAKSTVLFLLTSAQITLNFALIRPVYRPDVHDPDGPPHPPLALPQGRRRDPRLVAYYGPPTEEERLRMELVDISLELLFISFLLAFIARQMEKTSRVLYLWRREVEEQKEKAADIRQRNEQLVYNILPPHVATHFMGLRRKKHEELYSQSYEEVGVLFASMPNYSDFYSEESVNNQGLECLRFLNEVISDFDGLLENSPFKDIIKIKTIGSTYMAASGLQNTNLLSKGENIKERWSHLALLVDFAFELMRALQSINEQSFNHFVLRMGINHGPITAGVIGARKPHYDIWGNTVNVASRMESTGKAGCIQVTQDTTRILEHFGYIFEQRGVIAVKGKGDLLTYYIVGKKPESDPGQGAPTSVTGSPHRLADGEFNGPSNNNSNNYSGGNNVTQPNGRDGGSPH